MPRILAICFFIILMGCNEGSITEEIINEEVVEEVQTKEVTLISSNELEILASVTTNDTKHNLVLNKVNSIKNAKEIKTGIYQGVIEELDEGGGSLSIDFYTWLKKDTIIEVIDVHSFNKHTLNYGLAAGNFYLQLWNENEAFFLSYHDLKLTKEILENGKFGKMITSPISIGMNKEELIAILGPPIVTDWYDGGMLYCYNDMYYILDENFEVIAINLPGNRINTVLEEVPKQLGEPSSTTYSEADNTIYYIYELGKYYLEFQAFSKDKKVSTVLLYEN